MPRTARKRGESGFYHVVTKGDGGRILFESDEDRAWYLDLLASTSADKSIKVHAYCLMRNHVHLLLEDVSDALGPMMKRLDESYAMHFAAVADRVGHVFQGRYWSEPVESDAYYLCALRYIHANPEAAGLCQQDQYPWSSYPAHAGTYPSFVTTRLSHDLLNGAQGFVEFSKSGDWRATPFPGSRLRGHLNLDESLRIAQQIVGTDKLAHLQSLPREERMPLLARLVGAGFSENEVVRLTGVGKNEVHALKAQSN